MASYSSITIDDVASIGTTEKFISDETNPGSHISVAPNEILLMSVSIGSHGTDDITVTAYGSIPGTDAERYEVQSFVIEAGDTDEHQIGPFIGINNVDVGYVASGSTDTPTASTKATKGAMNSA